MRFSLLVILGLNALGTLKAQQISLPAERPISEVAIASLEIGGYPDFLVDDAEGVWVTNDGSVEKLQFGKSAPVKRVSMPAPCGVMAVGFGSLWVASCKEFVLYRINLKSGIVEAIIKTGLADQQGELSITIGAGSVWLLTNSRGELSQISPETNSVTNRINVLPNSFAVVFGNNSLWISNSKNSSLQRVDPKTGTVMATIPIGAEPRFLTFGHGAVWTLNQVDGTVSKVDANTHQVSNIDAQVKGTGGDIASGNKYIFVRAKNTLLSVIDPQTNKVISRFGPPSGSGAVRVENGRVWITAHDVNRIWVIKEE